MTGEGEPLQDTDGPSKLDQAKEAVRATAKPSRRQPSPLLTPLRGVGGRAHLLINQLIGRGRRLYARSP